MTEPSAPEPAPEQSPPPAASDQPPPPRPPEPPAQEEPPLTQPAPAEESQPQVFQQQEPPARQQPPESPRLEPQPLLPSQPQAPLRPPLPLPARVPGSPGRPVVRPLQAPPRKPAAPFVLPLATPLLLVLTLGAIGFFWSYGPVVFRAGTIGPTPGGEPAVDPHDPWTWFRLVSALFVHGRHHEFQALMVVGAIMYSGYRVERALGAGAMLVCFLVAGVAGDVVRLLSEAPALLKDSAGTTAGALALLGANASTSIRARERSFLAAIGSGIMSALFLTFFSCGQLQGVSFDFFPALLPGAGTAFLVGGMLGAVFPLRDPSKQRGLRGGLLGATLLVLGAAGVSYAASLRALLHGAPETSGTRHVVDDEAPSLVETWDERLKKYDFGMPTGHHKSRPDNADFPGAFLVPNILNLPQIDIMATPRDPRFSADGLAALMAKRLSEQYPDMKMLDEGPIDGCPLGPAYRHVVRVTVQDMQLDFQICVVQAESDFVIVRVHSDPEDLRAPAIAKAICRSLKLHAGPTDKKNGGR